ncbi:MAG: glycosyltransferase, partial [Chloroflexi bacterium]|nr:glycosyltransferase [Chloroflexota bacterium]
MLTLLRLIYHIIVLWTASYAVASMALLWLFWRHRRRPAARPPAPHRWPCVTVQLPVYNESAVVYRLLAAACALDYPPDLLEIQLLDDSTDGSTAGVRAWLAARPECARRVRVLHRRDRTGYKAGALAAGLRQATGEFLAIFDADFVPPPDFLRRTLPHLLARPELGMVQARWGYLNREAGLLTRAQALALDGHFVVEQFARNRAGLFMNFNGSAGVWRRSCVETSGGWQADTLCEDLDLSYRAQLAGWQYLYLPEVVCPSELPPVPGALRSQNARWAKGSVQCLLKDGPQLARAPVGLARRAAGLLHLSAYLVQPLTLAIILLMPP